MSSRFNVVGVFLMVAATAGVSVAQDGTEAVYRGWSKAVKFDVSPPLRSIAPVAPTAPPANLVDPEPGDIFPAGPNLSLIHI